MGAIFNHVNLFDFQTCQSLSLCKYDALFPLLWTFLPFHGHIAGISQYILGLDLKFNSSLISGFPQMDDEPTTAYRKMRNFPDILPYLTIEFLNVGPVLVFSDGEWKYSRANLLCEGRFGQEIHPCHKSHAQTCSWRWHHPSKHRNPLQRYVFSFRGHDHVRLCSHTAWPS